MDDKNIVGHNLGFSFLMKFHSSTKLLKNTPVCSQEMNININRLMTYSINTCTTIH